MADRDFYQILGLPRTASQDEIQSAYRRLARENHPDVNADPGAEDRFKNISEAYNVLSDPQTRRRYNAFGPDFRQVPEDVDPETWRRARGRTGAGARSRAGAGPGQASGTRFGFGGGEDIDLDELFGGLFGGRSARDFGAVPGADQVADIELTVEEAYRGGHRSLTIGSASTRRTLDVTIPPGVIDGQRIRLAGQGGRGSHGAEAGDLYLTVKIRPDQIFRLEGRDIHVELRLAPWDAALGASAAVPTPDGEAKVTVPAGTSSGRRLRLRGRGMPNPRGQPGDLYADVRIMVPARLTDAERELFEQLAATTDFDPRRRH
ncbi:MAG TPA: DnaJ C-terminal domain-containing protein [Streptosporangiaceae bacterium]|nr:DnaJ C-terminal domain-containing protein [Streptosporangiaceae bacterium]